MDYAVDYRGEVFGDADDQPAGRKFASAEMDRAAGADLHSGRPDPTERIHDTFDGGFVDARARIALAAFSGAGALVNGRAVHKIVDMLVRETRGDCDGADDAIAGLAAVSGGTAASIVESEMLCHARSWVRARPFARLGAGLGCALPLRWLVGGDAKGFDLEALIHVEALLAVQALDELAGRFSDGAGYARCVHLDRAAFRADFAVFVFQSDVVGVHGCAFLRRASSFLTSEGGMSSR